MKCSDAQERLSAFYDGELSSDARDSMAEHLAECRRCATDYAGFETVTRAVNNSPRANVPAAVWNGISAQLDADQRDEQIEGQFVPLPQSNKQQSAARASWRRLALAASILLLVGSAFWVSRGSHSDHDHSAEFVATMDHYLRTLEVTPKVRNSFYWTNTTVKLSIPRELYDLSAIVLRLPRGCQRVIRLHRRAS